MFSIKGEAEHFRNLQNVPGQEIKFHFCMLFMALTGCWLADLLYLSDPDQEFIIG